MVTLRTASLRCFTHILCFSKHNATLSELTIVAYVEYHIFHILQQKISYYIAKDYQRSACADQEGGGGQGIRTLPQKSQKYRVS